MSTHEISCPKCGAALNGDSLFCNYCGAAVTDVRDLLKEQEKNRLHKERVETDMAKKKQEMKSDKRGFIFAMLFMIVGLGAIIFMCMMAMR